MGGPLTHEHPIEAKTPLSKTSASNQSVSFDFQEHPVMELLYTACFDLVPCSGLLFNGIDVACPAECRDIADGMLRGGKMRPYLSQCA